MSGCTANRPVQDRIPDGIRKDLEDGAVLDGRHEVAVDLWIVVGRHQHPVMGGVRRRAEPFGDASRTRAVELEVADRRVVDEIAAPEAMELALAACERDARLGADPCEPEDRVEPGDGLLEPADPEGSKA